MSIEEYVMEIRYAKADDIQNDFRELKERIKNQESEVRGAREQLDEEEDYLLELEDKKRDLEKKLKKMQADEPEVRQCPRCHMSQEERADTLSLCCVRCGFCDLSAMGSEEDCPGCSGVLAR